MRRVTIELSDAQFALLKAVAANTRAVGHIPDWTIEEEARFCLMQELRRSAGTDEHAPARATEAAA